MESINENNNNVEKRLRFIRSYSITCADDVENIKTGKCPEYAQRWSAYFNQLHWQVGHNYVSGYNVNNDVKISDR